MTTLEKLERLVKERDGHLNLVTGEYRVSANGSRAFYAPTLTEAIDKAYESAFPTRKLEPGDLLWCGGFLYRVGGQGTSLWQGGIWSQSGYSLDELVNRVNRGYVIGKAYDEPVEVKP